MLWRKGAGVEKGKKEGKIACPLSVLTEGKKFSQKGVEGPTRSRGLHSHQVWGGHNKRGNAKRAKQGAAKKERGDKAANTRY